MQNNPSVSKMTERQDDRTETVQSRSSAKGASPSSSSGSDNNSGKGNAIKTSGDSASGNETNISRSDRLKIDPAELPPELFRKILSLLPFTSLRSAILVSEQQQNVVLCL